MKYRWKNSKRGRHVQVSEETKPPEQARGDIKYFQSIPSLTGSLSSTVVCFPSPSVSTTSFPLGWTYKRTFKSRKGIRPVRSRGSGKRHSLAASASSFPPGAAAGPAPAPAHTAPAQPHPRSTPSRRAPRSRRAARCAAPAAPWRCAAAAPRGCRPWPAPLPAFRRGRDGGPGDAAGGAGLPLRPRRPGSGGGGRWERRRRREGGCPRGGSRCCRGGEGGGPEPREAGGAGRQLPALSCRSVLLNRPVFPLRGVFPLPSDTGVIWQCAGQPGGQKASVHQAQCEQRGWSRCSQRWCGLTWNIV